MNESQTTYTFSARLVHALIIAIFASLLSIAGYMVVWAQSDASYKGDLTRRLIVIECDISWLQIQTANGILPLAKQRLEALEERVRENEREMRKHGLKD